MLRNPSRKGCALTPLGQSPPNTFWCRSHRNGSAELPALLSWQAACSSRCQAHRSHSNQPQQGNVRREKQNLRRNNIQEQSWGATTPPKYYQAIKTPHVASSSFTRRASHLHMDLGYLLFFLCIVKITPSKSSVGFSTLACNRFSKLTLPRGSSIYPAQLKSGHSFWELMYLCTGTARWAAFSLKLLRSPSLPCTRTELGQRLTN